MEFLTCLSEMPLNFPFVYIISATLFLARGRTIAWLQNISWGNTLFLAPDQESGRSIVALNRFPQLKVPISCTEAEVTYIIMFHEYNGPRNLTKLPINCLHQATNVDLYRGANESVPERSTVKDAREMRAYK